MLSQDEIKDMQRQLGVPQDGVMGPNTIKALQRKIGVPADGVVGPRTIAALKKSGATLWAAELQSQTSAGKSHHSKPSGKPTSPPSPAVFAVKPPVTLHIDMAKMAKAGLGILGAGMLALAVMAGKRMRSS